ncbi:MAG: HNH endonuclease [Deltaproteobacteria bacterium]|nr:HNH endonuclease [Deltaproteobacteria bacterium]
MLGLHATAREWFEDRDLYHKIGFLVAEGTRLSALVAEAKGTPRTAFHASLAERIREATGMTRAEAEDLRYTKPADLCPLARLLLLMNVEAVRRLRDSSERYSFRAHKRQSWSLEHIHAQQAERLSKKEQWQEWLRRHREALAGPPPSVARDALAARIDAAYDTIDRDQFDQLAAEVAAMFSAADGADGTTDWVHSLANLALLSSGANSALGNSVFEVKRRAVLDLDRAGAFIPICTRRVFLKYFTGADAQQVHFWSPQDRGAYLDAMFNPTDGLLKDYMHAEAAK